MHYSFYYAATIDMTSDTTYHANELILFTSVNRNIKISILFNDCWRKPINRPRISTCKLNVHTYSYLYLTKNEIVTVLVHTF